MKSVIAGRASSLFLGPLPGMFRFEQVEHIRGAAEEVALRRPKTGTLYRCSSERGPNFDAPAPIFGSSKEKQSGPTVK
jgi:hypothetical protein